MIRAAVVDLLIAGLRFYTRFVPFARGRGLFLRPLMLLKRRGWPSPLVSIGGNLTMELEPSLLGWTIFERGAWEPAQTAIILRLLRAGDIVLDVGANTGYYVLLAAAAVGGNGHVHAFEIQSEMRAILRRNIERNALANVTVVDSGCWSRAGDAAIFTEGDPASARIDFSDRSGARVRLTTIDNYVSAAGLDRVDLILIDTEGADFEVLKGAAAVLERFHPIVLAETHHLAVYGGSENELRDFMAQFGYKGESLYGEFSTDVLFLPPHRADRVMTS